MMGDLSVKIKLYKYQGKMSELYYNMGVGNAFPTNSKSNKGKMIKQTTDNIILEFHAKTIHHNWCKKTNDKIGENTCNEYHRWRCQFFNVLLGLKS